MKYIKTALASYFVALCLPAFAQGIEIKSASDANALRPWVLIETHITNENNGGAIGSSFQEFSSKERCEAGIKLLMQLSRRHRGGLGGTYKPPIAECVMK